MLQGKRQDGLTQCEGWGVRGLRLAAVLVATCVGLLLGGPGVSAAIMPAQALPIVDQVIEPSSVTPAAGQPVAFTLALNGSQGGLSGNVNWSFGDGSSVMLNGSQGTTHVFTSPGQYNITLTGTSASGQTITASTSIRVVGAPAVAPVTTPGNVTVTGPTSIAPPQSALAPTSVAIANPPTTAQVNQPITFTASNAVSPNPCGVIAGYRWDFGDGTPQVSGQTVAHPYTAAGSYNVNLTVTDCSGSTNSASDQVSVTTAPPPGISVSYAAGWELLAGPTGTVVTGNSGPDYTLRAGDTSYELLQNGAPLTSGVGYWAYFPGAATSTIALSGAGSITVQLPAGQFIMIGNPGNSPATVSGADSVLVYDAASNGYSQSTVLQPGEGAWALSISGGTATITNGP